MKKLSLAVVGVLIVLAAAACGGYEPADDEVVIGSVHPLTGALAGQGEMMHEGAQLAVDDLNEAGGIESLGGDSLVLRAGDSKGTADAGQIEAQRLVSEGAVALIGTYQSDVTANVSAVAERNRVPLVIDVAVDDVILEQGYEHTFRIQPNASSMGRDGAIALAELSKANGKPVRTVSYLHIEGAFGQSVHDAFEKEAADQGIDVVSEVTYPATNFTDATTQVREALAADPDVVVVTGYYPDSLLIAQAVRSLGGDVDALYGIANGGFDDSAFPADSGPAGADVLSANYHYAATDERAQDIRARFEQKYGRTMETSAMLAYQAVVVIAQGLEESGSKDPEELRDAIADLEIDDPLLEFGGPIAFDEAGENENASVTVMQIRDGKVEQVFPDEFKTADIVYPAGRAAGAKE
ncbi:MULTISPECIES: ABC transporter substrate-binding protein [unclassified Nocardioides]|uniref:ABC transporter substrate-binding protein n=1 Tax=unclassified Nocardioides TaxID=2615069 RepID=UPI003015810B